MNDQAKLFAERLKKEHPNNLDQQIKQAIRLTTGRIATQDEIEKDKKFIQSLIDNEKLNLDTALQNYALVILNANEFFYLD